MTYLVKGSPYRPSRFWDYVKTNSPMVLAELKRRGYEVLKSPNPNIIFREEIL